MSDWIHTLYTVISFFVIALSLILCNKYVKDDKYKDRVLKISASLVVIIHYSRLYVDYFSTGSASVDSSMLLPVFPCHLAMWSLFLIAFKKRDNKFFKILMEITFYIGVVGGILGEVLNDSYINTPNLGDWDVLSGLLSHTVMTFGCLYLLVGGYIKISMKNTISVAIGIAFLAVYGLFVIGLFSIFRLDPPNTMYLLEKPYPEFPWINTYTIAIAGVSAAYLITSTYELIAFDKEDRWYNKLKNKNLSNDNNK